MLKLARANDLTVLVTEIGAIKSEACHGTLTAVNELYGQYPDVVRGAALWTYTPRNWDNYPLLISGVNDSRWQVFQPNASLAAGAGGATGLGLLSAGASLFSEGHNTGSSSVNYEYSSTAWTFDLLLSVAVLAPALVVLYRMLKPKEKEEQSDLSCHVRRCLRSLRSFKVHLTYIISSEIYQERRGLLLTGRHSWV